jgi:ABC-2 type transport system permease protein
MLDRRALRKIGVVFWREYVATVRTKAFVMALVSLPLLSLLSLCVPLLGGVGGRLPDLRCVVVDQTGGALFSALEQAAERHNRLLAADQPTAPNGRVFVEAWPSAYDQEARVTLSDQVRSGELSGFVEIGRDVFDLDRGRLSLRYHASSGAQWLLGNWLETELVPAIHRERLQRSGLDPGQVERARASVVFTPEALDRAGMPSAASNGPAADLAIPALAAILMFLAVMLGAAPLMQSVLEEKGQRIAEILIASVPPFQLLLGKLLGASAVSLLLSAAYFGGGYSIAVLLDYGAWFTLRNVACLLSFELIALFMYGSVFLAIGSLCSDLRESQTVMLPAMVLASMPLLLLPVVLAEPHSDLVTVLSLVPFFTPVLMMIRATLVPSAPVWQVLLGALLSSGMALLCVAFAGRCLKAGLLSRGPAPRFRELLVWLRQS